MSELTGELLQAIYDASWERYEVFIRSGNPAPVGSNEILEDLLEKGYEITECQVKEGFRFLERLGSVDLGSGGIFGNCGKTLFIEDFFQ